MPRCEKMWAYTTMKEWGGEMPYRAKALRSVFETCLMHALLLFTVESAFYVFLCQTFGTA